MYLLGPALYKIGGMGILSHSEVLDNLLKIPKHTPMIILCFEYVVI